MIEQLPIWVSALFILCTIYALLMFHLSNRNSIKITGLLLVWCIFQSILSFNAFYNNVEAFPPRYVIVLLPPLIVILLALRKNNLNKIIHNRNLGYSTFLHAVRIPVEICLLYLFVHKQVPKLMTFEGRNYDIIAGITALLIGYLFIKNKINKKTLLIWNYLGMVLIIFILLNGALSSRLPIQVFGFDQPNIAMEYFPFILLPGLIVPIVIFTHITDIIKLHRTINN